VTQKTRIVATRRLDWKPINDRKVDKGNRRPTRDLLLECSRSPPTPYLPSQQPPHHTVPTSKPQHHPQPPSPSPFLLSPAQNSASSAQDQPPASTPYPLDTQAASKPEVSERLPFQHPNPSHHHIFAPYRAHCGNPGARPTPWCIR
jgi:hypothetical protein